MYRGSGSCDSEEWRDTTTGQSYVYVLKKLLVVDMVGSKPNAKFNRWRSAGSFFPAKRRKNYALYVYVLRKSYPFRG